MDTNYFEKWRELSDKIQEPFKSFAELNVKTLQSFQYLHPDELSQLKKPEELIATQFSRMIQNGHLALDYMQASFELFQKTMQTNLKNIKK